MELFKEYKDIVTVNDLTKMLGIGRNTAYKLVNSQAIPNYKIDDGRKHYITKQQVIDYVTHAAANT